MNQIYNPLLKLLAPLKSSMKDKDYYAIFHRWAYNTFKERDEVREKLLLELEYSKADMEHCLFFAIESANFLRERKLDKNSYPDPVQVLIATEIVDSLLVICERKFDELYPLYNPRG